MIMIWGSRLYGKVDEVAGLFFVATKFGHLWYIPLIPMGSYIVVEQNGNEWRGVSCGLSLKSWLAAWLRVGSGIALIVAAMIAIVNYNDHQRDWQVPAAAAGVSLVVLIWSMTSRALKRASRDRARRLGERLNLDAEGMALIDTTYQQAERGGVAASHSSSFAAPQPPVGERSAGAFGERSGDPFRERRT